MIIKPLIISFRVFIKYLKKLIYMTNSILQYISKSDKDNEICYVWRDTYPVMHLKTVFSEDDSIFLNNYMRKLCVV